MTESQLAPSLRDDERFDDASDASEREAEVLARIRI
jgi:hypothetical protein